MNAAAIAVAEDAIDGHPEIDFTKKLVICCSRGEHSVEVAETLEEKGVGAIAYSPLKQGILTGKYLNGIPEDSRAHGHSQFLKESSLTPEVMETTRKLKEIADKRGDTLSHMALAWVLAQKQMASVILGARNLEQIKDNLKALECAPFSDEENRTIDSLIRK